MSEIDSTAASHKAAPGTAADSSQPAAPGVVNAETAQPTAAVLPAGQTALAERDAKQAPDAILFVPGLIAAGGPGPDQSIDGVARRILAAVENSMRWPDDTTFRMGVSEVKYGGDGSNFRTRVCTAFQKSQSGERAILDFYSVEYGTSLTRDFQARNLLIQSLLSVFTVISGMSLLFASRARERKKDARDAQAAGATSTPAASKGQPLTARQKRQFLWASIILLLISAYTIILIVTLVDAVVHWRPPSSPNEVTVDTKQAPKQAADGKLTVPTAGVVGMKWSHYEKLRAPVRSLVILLTAIGLLSKNDWKRKLSSVATQYLSVYQYIRGGEIRPELRGQVESLLSEIARRRPEYENIHVVAFSFGSILVLDSCFPPTTRAMLWDEVETLTTIGCPFDLIRTLWPGYFRSRQLADGAAPRKWCNIFMLNDILGANFRNDELARPAEEGIEADASGGKGVRKPDDNIHFEVGVVEDGTSWLNVIELFGFQAHGLYWGHDNQSEANCFNEVVKFLFPTGIPQAR
jgi:hypothetical protein